MKLKGNDALDKANRLFESMATSPKVDSFSNVESKHLGYDGKYYAIVKENTQFVLKKSTKVNPIIAEDFDYINGVQNKARYTKRGYNDMLKQYNLMNIELKRVNGETLFMEALEKENKLLTEQKAVIKVKKKPLDQ